MKQPELGWTTPVKIKRVIDGDTVKVEVSREITVRLTDEEGTFDAPETWRPETPEEKIRGEEYTEKLFHLLFKTFDPGDGDILIRQRDNVVLFIPTDDRGRIQDIFSIGSRAVGHLFVDGVDVVEELKKMDTN